MSVHLLSSYRLYQTFFKQGVWYLSFVCWKKIALNYSPHFIYLVIIPYEEVVNQLAADTLSTDASIGINGGRFTAGSFSKLLKISITVNLNDSFRIMFVILKQFLLIILRN